MTQPPDDRPRMPWDPDQPDAGEEPTVAWTPPTPAAASGEDAGPGAAEPEPDAGTPPAASPEPVAPPTPPEPVAPTDPPEPVAPLVDAPTPPTQADAPAATGPLLSSTPSTPATGWQQPAVPPPVVGWQVQDAGAEAAPVEGYVIAGPWARLVAWWIDSFLVTLIPTLLSFLVIDWRPFIEAMFEQARNPSAVPVTPVLPMTTETVIVSIIGVGLSYLYFVGFWTGPWMATPGMRLLRMRVGDEHRGAILSLTAASKRWLAMGAWLALLAVVAPLAAVAGFGLQLLQIALFISVIVNSRRQGLHDRFAGSIVVREQGSGNGAVVMGCAVLVALAILMTIVFGAIFMTVVYPVIEPLMDEFRMTR